MCSGMFKTDLKNFIAEAICCKIILLVAQSFSLVIFTYV